MMALYMPMQPSSKMPTMALSVTSLSAMAWPSWSSGLEAGRAGRGCTWEASWTTLPASTHCLMPWRNNSSVKSTLQMVEYALPILVNDPFRLSRPTKPGQVPSKLATVRTGPLWERRPARTWWLYCQTVSATTKGASGGTWANTDIPMRWLSMKPCFLIGS